MKQKKDKGPAEVDYDYETDTFSARRLDKEYDSSHQIGDLIFDLNKDNEVIGVEILSASKVFNIPKNHLRNNLSGNLTIDVDKESIRMKLLITSKARNAEKSSNINVEKKRPDFVSPSEMNVAVA